MLRNLAVTASLLAITAAPGLAQTHSGSHERPRAHGPGHVRPDSATHAAMHALFHGSWAGTVTSPRGVSNGLVMTVGQDGLKRTTLTMATDQPKRGGAASELVLVGDKQLRWTQDLSGTRCVASAKLRAATATSPEALSGTMSCDGVESAFTLRKTSAE